MGYFKHALDILNTERFNLEGKIKNCKIMGKPFPPSSDDIKRYHEVMAALHCLKSFDNDFPLTQKAQKGVE